jgi:short-subunit dehydrogenase
VNGVQEWSGRAWGLMSVFNRGNATETDTDVYAVAHALDDLAPRTKALERWWGGKTKGRRGVLVWFMPAFLSQMVVVQTMLPFLLDRLLLYQQPELLLLTAALSQPMLQKGLKLVISSGIWSGVVFMAYDSYRAGSKWTPFSAGVSGDSYALVTGADGALGKDLAALLFADGYSVILAGASRLGLAEAEEDIVEFVRQARRGHHHHRVANGVPPASSFPTHLSSSSCSSLAVARGTAAAEIITVPCDLSVASGAAHLVRQLRALAVHNKLDVLVYAAGESHDGAQAAPALRSINTNIGSLTTLLEGLVPGMAARTKKSGQGSRVLILGSTAALAPAPNGAVFAASKAFLNSYAASLRRRYLTQGVLVTLAMNSPQASLGEGSSTSSGDEGSQKPLAAPLLAKKRHAVLIYRALNQGRDMVVPGRFDKLYVGLITKLLPPVALTSLAQYWWKLTAPGGSIHGDRVRRDVYPLDMEDSEEPRGLFTRRDEEGDGGQSGDQDGDLGDWLQGDLQDSALDLPPPAAGEHGDKFDQSGIDRIIL